MTIPFKNDSGPQKWFFAVFLENTAVFQKKLMKKYSAPNL